VFPGLEALGPFGRGENRWVDFPIEALLCRPQRVHDLGEGRCSDDQNVHVARRGERPPCAGTVHQGHADTAREHVQGSGQDVSQPDRLGHDPRQLGVDGARRLHLEVDLPALLGSPNDPGAAQGGQLSLNRADSRARGSHDGTQMEPLVWVAEQQGEDGAARLSQERGRESGRWELSTHFEYECTQYRYA